jgi:hypothetical protein
MLGFPKVRAVQTRPGQLRQSERKQVLILAKCRRRAGISDPVSITDLSAEGCSISYPCSTLKIGQQVTIKPATMDGIPGTVRWVTADGAGIEFERPLYAPVVEHLQREFANLSTGLSPGTQPRGPNFRRL